MKKIIAIAFLVVPFAAQTLSAEGIFDVGNFIVENKCNMPLHFEMIMNGEIKNTDLKKIVNGGRKSDIIDMGKLRVYVSYITITTNHGGQYYYQITFLDKSNKDAPNVVNQPQQNRKNFLIMVCPNGKFEGDFQDNFAGGSGPYVTRKANKKSKY